jgi:predicted hydrocarbon binding protein
MFTKPLTIRHKDEFLTKIEESIYSWRKKYYEEIQLSHPPRPIAGTLRYEDFLALSRPFFSSIDESDTFYVNLYRSIEFSSLKSHLASKVVVMHKAGYDLGSKMVESGVIKSLDDALLALPLYRIGLLDVITEKLDYMKLNIYECISCYGIPNINRTLCDFEAGVLQGILTKLYGSCTIHEKYCFGTGYSFCGFEAFFE